MPQDSVTPRVSPPLPANIVFLSSPLSFFLSCAKQGALINQVLQEKSPQVSRGRSAQRHKARYPQLGWGCRARHKG